ncbi:MAG: NFACT family protein [Treponema sp.]|jgi:predicted ribosome quality control (RQC) complex YloA/Tae2 family protein|nr:NFACT family protein [Treponema sp.]
MSLNWKEIDLILEELNLPGLWIQKVYQSAYDVLCLQLYGRGKSLMLLAALSPGACRLHETAGGAVKSERPLRFAEFCKAHLVNGRIEEAAQLGDNRIVRLVIRRGGAVGGLCYRCYIRLWSNAANIIVTDERGTILDAMRRSPKRGEVTGGRYAPEDALAASGERREFHVRELSGPGTFNEKIDAWYAEHGGALSLEALREQARKTFDSGSRRLEASLERLRAKEADYASADSLREYGDIIMANLGAVKLGDPWLEAENFYRGGTARIKLDPRMSPAASAERYYDQYRKAKNGLAEVQREIAAGEQELRKLKQTLERLLGETNPLILHKLLKNKGQKPAAPSDRKRPGLSFRRKDWLLIVGRDAGENDELLRRHVKGNDLWLHARDYAGSYVFIKQRPGKSVPLDILLDGGNLALFYSKGRGNGEGNLFYTPVKYLRRAKGGPPGLVLPTHEKNLRVRLDPARLRELESCRIEKEK